MPFSDINKKFEYALFMNYPLIGNMPMNTWSIVGVSWQKSNGRGILFLNDQRIDQSGLLADSTTQNTQANIQIGKANIDLHSYRSGFITALFCRVFLINHHIY